jgi:hypothetical protein
MDPIWRILDLTDQILKLEFLEVLEPSGTDPEIPVDICQLWEESDHSIIPPQGKNLPVQWFKYCVFRSTLQYISWTNYDFSINTFFNMGVFLRVF